MNPVLIRGRFSWRCVATAALAVTLCVCGSTLRAQASGLNETTCEQELPQLRQEAQNLQERSNLPQSERTAQKEPRPAPVSELAVNEQTLTGWLTCDARVAGSYTCGHSKNEPIWGCTLHCAKGPDGFQYALQTAAKTYSVTGDPKQLRHFAADDVVVIGEVTGDAIRIRSIKRQSHKDWAPSLTR
jgi:hypothetical protein